MDWYELLPKILNMSLTASVISVTVIILRLLLKRAPKVYSYMLWSVVLFRLLCPITINTPLSVLKVKVLLDTFTNTFLILLFKISFVK